MTHLGLYAWAVCLRWSSFYHSGGKNDGLKMSLISNVFGATVSTVTLLIVGTVVGSLVVTSALVGVGVAGVLSEEL
ncbi:MAG: DUF1097 family protein [Rhodobacterales bacterium]